MSEGDQVGCGVFFFIALSTALFVGGCIIGERHEREKAARAGVGKWVVNPSTGDTEFKYGRD